LSACAVVSFGLFEIESAVAFVASEVGWGTVILKSGFDGVYGIMTLGT
jgi:hypothetical protein